VYLNKGAQLCAKMVWNVGQLEPLMKGEQALTCLRDSSLDNITAVRLNLQ
jgi:hypothetical protein